MNNSIMTREEIINQGRPIEPNCFETDREEQWYSLGLYDGATANPWHSVADGDFPKTRNGTVYLLDGVTCKNAYIVTDGKEWWIDYYVPMYNTWASQSTPTHWMEIPQLPNIRKIIK